MVQYPTTYSITKCHTGQRYFPQDASYQFQYQSGFLLLHNTMYIFWYMRLIEKGKVYRRRAHSVNRLRWLRSVCVDIGVIGRLDVSATVLLDGLHWSHGCLGRICQSCDGVVPGGSPLHGLFHVVSICCRRCLTQRIVECGILKPLTLSAFSKLVFSIPIVLLCRRVMRRPKQLILVTVYCDEHLHF